MKKKETKKPHGPGIFSVGSYEHPEILSTRPIISKDNLIYRKTVALKLDFMRPD